jgi:uncharacterized phage protein (TIGR02216 family)
MGVGLGVLALSPDAFWSMTLKELAAAIRGRFGPGPSPPLSRSDLDALMKRFPDTGAADRVNANQRGAS